MLSVICLVFVSTVIICSASWSIKHSENRNLDTANITAGDSYLDDNKFTPDTLGEYFTTGKDEEGNATAIYNGKSQKPTITLAGAKALWGLEPSDPNDEEAVKTFLDSLYGTKYTVEWQAGTYANYDVDKNGKNDDDPITNADYKEIVAGKHYYRIVDVDTGSVICYKHLYNIEPVEINAVEIELTTAGYNDCIGFEGKTLAWKGTLNGINSSGNSAQVASFTLSKTLDYNAAGTTTAYDTNTFNGYVKDVTLDWETITANNHKISDNLEYVAECYVLPTTKTSGGKYFGSLGEAIDATTSGTIYPMQSFHYSIELQDGTVKASPKDNSATTDVNEEDPVTVGTSLKAGDYTHVLKDKQYTIGANVTLCIPYGTGTSYFGSADKVTDAKRNAYHNANYLKNDVRIEAITDDKGEFVPTLINKGTIQIPGQINGAQSTYVSITGGLHSQITLGKDAILQNTTGSIKCHGFIDAETFDNGSKVDMVGGTIETIISIVEHYGGSKLLDISSDANNKVTPFNRFYVQSVTANLSVSNNAKVTGYADVYINTVKMHVDQTINLFGNVEGAFVQFTANNTSLNLTFNPNTEQNELYVKGSVKVNKITISKTILFIYDVNLTTEGLYMPISHYWDITFDVADGGSAATVNSEGQHIRVMPGASITIEKGVTFNGSEVIVYEGTALQFDPPNNYNYYTKANASTTVAKEDGVLLVKGALNVKKLGGSVQAEKGATLSVTESNEVTVTELIYVPNDSGSYEYKNVDVKRTATGKLAENGKVTETGTLLKVADLSNTNGVSAENAYYKACATDTWSYLRSITISYNVNGSTVAPVTGIAPKSEILWSNEGITLSGNYYPNPTRDYYTFNQWTIASNGSAASGKTVYSNTTLNANWNAITYKIRFNYPAVAGFTLPTPPNMMEFTVEDTQDGMLTLSNSAAVGDYFFNGWYSDNAFENEITGGGYTVKLSALKNLGTYNESTNERSMTLYGQWTNVSYTIRFDMNLQTNTTAESITAKTVGLAQSAQALPTIADLATNQYYHTGWMCGDVVVATYGQVIDLITEGKVTANDDGTYTIIAQWAKKDYTLIVSGSSGASQNAITIEEKRFYYTAAVLENGLSLDFLNEIFTPGRYDDNSVVENRAVNKFFKGWYFEGDSYTEINEDIYTSNKLTELTLTATWGTKAKVTFNINLTISDVSDPQAVWLTPSKTVYQVYDDLFKDTCNTMVEVSNKNLTSPYTKYFDCLDIESVTPVEDAVIDVTAQWKSKSVIKVQTEEGIKGDSSADAKYKIMVYDGEGNLVYGDKDYTQSSAGSEKTYYVTPGFYVAFDYDNTGGSDDYVCDMPTSDNMYLVPKDTTKTYTIYSRGKNGCFAPGTLITLADGTQKKIEDLLESDVLLVFDHETGKFVAAPILFIERDGWAEYNVINLKFSDGRITRLIYEHALFDVTLNKYVYITEDNCTEFIGHEFVVAEGDELTTVTLTEAFVTTEYVGCYSLVTAYHLNYFIDGMLSIPGGIDGLFNIFEYDETLKYDEEQMAKDIEKYGLYTYEDFAEYMPEEVYNMFPAQYFKVAVGKGYITFEEIVELIDRYLVGHGIVLQN